MWSVSQTILGQRSKNHRGWKNCDELAIKGKLVSLLDDLMWSTNQIKLISFQKLLDSIFAVVITDSSFNIVRPALDSGFRISPHHIRENFVLHTFNRSFNGVEGRKIFNKRTDPSMNTEYASTYNCSNWKRVETIRDEFECFDARPSLTFIIKSIKLV